MRNMEKRNTKASTLVMFQSAIMLVITIIVMSIVYNASFHTITGGLQSTTMGRVGSITDYFKFIESRLEVYAESSEVDALLHKTDSAAAIADSDTLARRVCNLFDSAEEANVFVMDWDTNVLSSSESNMVGRQLITGEGLDGFHGMLMARKGFVTNSGIIANPVTNKLQFTCYKGIFDGERPLGIVAITINAENIIRIMPEINAQTTSGAEYEISVINTKTGLYVDSTNADKIGTNLDIDKLNNVLTEVAESKSFEPVTSSLMHTVKGKKMALGYAILPGYSTMVTFDVAYNGFYRINSLIITFVVIYIVFSAVMMIVMNIISKKQEELRMKINKQQLQNERVKDTLNDAVFKDLLTSVKNRTAFAMDAEKARISEYDTCYFGLVSIEGLSDINIMFGNDTGDIIINKVAEICREAFEGAAIYRTGSGEFLIVNQTESNIENHNKFIADMNMLKVKLNKTYSSPAGQVTVACHLAAAKKSSNINSSIITILKRTIKTAPPAILRNQIPFEDLDNA